MKLGLDGKVVFDDYMEFKANCILQAFEGKNSDIRSHSIEYQEIPNGHYGKDRHRVITDSSVDGNGIYLYYREDPLNAMRSFMYCGVTTSKGIRQRFSKVSRHALGNVHSGDSVIPLSRYLRNECRGDLEDIRVCFVPYEAPVAEMKELEKRLIKKLKRKYGNTVKNVSDGETVRRVVNKFECTEQLPL